MVSTGEITDVFEKMDGLEKEFASFKAKIESIQRTTQVESAELDITRPDELKDNLIEDQGVDPFAGSNCTDPTAVDMIRMKNNYLLPCIRRIPYRFAEMQNRYRYSPIASLSLKSKSWMR
ncbi:hypothetical protein AYX13_03917 [Cryptococcus neoformans]|nr:hypothetical protein AYX13_03917 [Cryptococcus neoformans var. grubii]